MASYDRGERSAALSLDDEHAADLRVLERALGKSTNEVVNEAVADYLRIRMAEAEASLGATLDRIRAYRRANAIDVVEAPSKKFKMAARKKKR